MMQQAQAGLEGKGGAGEEDSGVRKRGPKDGRSGNGTSGMASAPASASQPAVQRWVVPLLQADVPGKALSG